MSELPQFVRVAAGRRNLAVQAWLLTAVSGLSFFVAHVTIGLGGQKLDWFAGTWVYDSLEVLAVVAVAARALLVRAERLAWASLAVGLASWTAGDIVWSTVYSGNPPFPSIADACYLGFFPPTYLALALLVRQRLSRFNASIWLDGVMAALSFAAVGAAVLLEVIIHGNQGRLLEDATNLAYPLGDIVLVALVVGVFGITGWRPGRVWAAIALGLVMTATADSIYLYQAATDSYSAGTILDALWPASFLFLAGAAWISPGRQKRVQLEGRPLAATPAVCGLIALGVLVDSYFERRNVVGVALAAAALTTVIARTLLTFSENGRITDRANELALTDPLTGLWNRRKLLADLDRWLTGGQPDPRLLILYDLNGFKRYNDTFGHPAGDALLSRLARKLQESLPPNASCYRLGGDEFCSFALVDPASVERFLTATTRALGEEGEGFTISTAFGCVFLPDEATDVSEALHIADQRLYAQKHHSLIERGQPHGVLLQALYEREPVLHEHGGGVAALSIALGRELGLPDDALEELELAAQLHDVGKLAIPDGVLTRPGPLDEVEWDFIHRHTIIGQRILEASPALSRVGQIVRATHERWDGAGYPDGVAGSEIPLAARIVSICDAYSAMTTGRPYRQARSPQEALAELKKCSGSQFDPTIVNAFSKLQRIAAVADPASTLGAG